MTSSGAFGATRDLLCRPLPAAVVLIAALVVLSFGMSTGGYLGTDTGAKVATLEVMQERGTARPVLGYWAEDLDPDGNLHPILDSQPVDGDWVHVTTLPMLELARPLWALGGYRATLILPILGAVGAAFAARSLARRTAGDVAGWQAFWAIGLASPLAVYALDLWEHAPGVGCMAGAIAILVGIVDGDRRWYLAAAAGALLGLAATMRTEAFVYSFVALGVTCLVLAFARRALALAVRVGLLAIGGFSVPWLANSALEGALGGKSRGGRTGGVASRGLGQGTERLEEALTTLLALRPKSLSETVILGGLAAGLVAGGLIADRRGDRRLGIVLLVGAGFLHLLVFARGLGFVPGMLAAAPIVVAALIRPPRGDGARAALGIALGSLPLVWAFQFVGGAGPQWGGRYALTSCVLLMALGVAALQGASVEVRRIMFGLAVGVTATGLLWLSERSRDMEALFDELVERPEDVVVARNGFFIREGGAAYAERLWLTAVTDDDLAEAVAVIGDAGHDTLAVLDGSPTAPEDLAGAAHRGTDPVTVVGVTLYLHSYAL